MSAKPRQIKVKRVTEALWRVAETDDVDELQRILATGADINATNVHGMTALMRAAYHGRLEMVRALIANGAHPNATRSDKFTPLLIAAFFGHTEIVRILVEHGAETKAVTRFGTSAPMWATAHNFRELARYLENDSSSTANIEAKSVAPSETKSAPQTTDSAQVSVQRDLTVATPAASVKRAAASETPGEKSPVAVPVVKTLKDPPEIWDLVHEAPRHFDPRSAFLSRLKSRVFPTKRNSAPQTTDSAPVSVQRNLTVATPAASVNRAVASETTGEKSPVATQVVKTLKDPPEIWDLVHEAPRHFDPRSAFLSRLKSTNASLAVRALMVVLLISACAFAVLTLKGAKARNNGDGRLKPQALSDLGATANRESSERVGIDAGEESSATSDAVPEDSALDDSRSHHVNPENGSLADTSKIASTSARAAASSDENSRRRISVRPRRETHNRSETHIGDADRDVNSGVAPKTAPARVSPQTHAPVSAEATTKKKESTPLGSQLITPAKNSQPKAKVIQWP